LEHAALNFIAAVTAAIPYNSIPRAAVNHYILMINKNVSHDATNIC